MENTAVPTPKEIHEAVDVLQRSEKELEAYCATLSASDWAHSDGPGRWTPAGIVEHLAILEPAALKMAKERIAGAAETDWQARTESKYAAVAGIASVTRRIETDEWLRPHGAQTPQELLRGLHAAREATVAYVQQPGLALKEHTFEHPAVGTVNGLQFFQALGYHTLRHLGQMKRCGQAA